MTEPQARITVEELNVYLRQAGFDHLATSLVNIESIEYGKVRFWRDLSAPEHHRMGGTVAGPALFWMCDGALFFAVVSALGVKAAPSVTATMTMNFLRAVKPGKVYAESRLTKIGRQLIMGDVMIYQEDDPEPCVHATGIFSGVSGNYPTIDKVLETDERTPSAP